MEVRREVISELSVEVGGENWGENLGGCRSEQGVQTSGSNVNVPKTYVSIRVLFSFATYNLLKKKSCQWHLNCFQLLGAIFLDFFSLEKSNSRQSTSYTVN
jgi:hypothetical protein